VSTVVARIVPQEQLSDESSQSDISDLQQDLMVF
jgi:hypothetical protein